MTVITKEIIKKIEAGTPITNEELCVAIEFYRLMETSLMLLGKSFIHARRAVTEELQSLEMFADARSAKTTMRSPPYSFH
jgi:hypothetical protein